MNKRPALRHHLAALAMVPLLFGCEANAKSVTHAEASAAIRKCGMSPDALLWRVDEKDGIVFGRKAAEAPAPGDEQLMCFMNWATDNKAKVSFVGWETGGS